MKKLVIVLMAMLIAGSAVAAKVEGPAVPMVTGTIESLVTDDQVCFLFEGPGAVFAQYAGPIGPGDIYEAVGNFTMFLEGTSFTWASDFCILFGNADLTEVYIQIGGFSDFGATIVAVGGWGGQGNDGTAYTSVVNAVVDLGGLFSIGGYYMYIGNGYASGGNNIWEGCVDLNGDAVAVDDISLGAIKALYR